MGFLISCFEYDSLSEYAEIDDEFEDDCLNDDYEEIELN